MIRSPWLGAGLIAVFGLLGCTKTPGAVCKDATGRSIENPGYCKLYPTQDAGAVDFAYRRPSSGEGLLGRR
jgi:hypothetical protein